MATPSSGRQRGRPPYPLLTPAEERVLGHLRHGLTNAEIATRLGVSPDAVKYHVSNMLGKLGLESREQLAAWRETSGLRRVWAAAPWFGWKVAAAATGTAVVAAGGIMAWGLSRGDSEPEVTFRPEDLFVGVLSLGIDGEPPNGPSANPSISWDGRFVAFESEATNLVKGDTNGFSDIFVFDRLTGETKRVSLAPGGKEANGHSRRPAISADNKWVAFDSEASNLVKDDVNGELDRALPLLSENSRKQLDPPTSDGARSVIADVRTWGGTDVFVVERVTGKLEIVSVLTDETRANLGSYASAISADGRYIAFQSSAPNLAGRLLAHPGAEDVSFGNVLGRDVYLRDREKGSTRRLSAAADPAVDEMRFGSGFPVITPDGTHVAFASREGRLSGNDRQGTTYYVWSRSGGLRQVPWPETPPGADAPLFGLGESRPALSDDGTNLAFSFRGFAPVRPSSAALEVDALFFHREGEATPTIIPGTEGMSELARSGLAFDSALGAFVLPVLLSGEFQQVTFSPGDTRFAPIANLAGQGTFIAPAVSGDGRWIVGMDLGPSVSSRPLSRVVVFPR